MLNCYMKKMIVFINNLSLSSLEKLKGKIISLSFIYHLKCVLPVVTYLTLYIPKVLSTSSVRNKYCQAIDLQEIYINVLSEWFLYFHMNLL